MADVPVLSDSVQLLAGAVGVALAAGVTVIGWLRGKTSQPVNQVEAAAGIIDNRGVNALVNCIDQAIESMVETSTRDTRARREMIEVLGELKSEISDLKDEIGSIKRPLVRLVNKDP